MFQFQGSGSVDVKHRRKESSTIAAAASVNTDWLMPIISASVTSWLVFVSNLVCSCTHRIPTRNETKPTQSRCLPPEICAKTQAEFILFPYFESTPQDCVTFEVRQVFRGKGIVFESVTHLPLRSFRPRCMLRPVPVRPSCWEKGEPRVLFNLFP
jgi:hypothetical protein